MVMGKITVNADWLDRYENFENAIKYLQVCLPQGKTTKTIAAVDAKKILADQEREIKSLRKQLKLGKGNKENGQEPKSRSEEERKKWAAKVRRYREWKKMSRAEQRQIIGDREKWNLGKKKSATDEKRMTKEQARRKLAQLESKIKRSQAMLDSSGSDSDSSQDPADEIKGSRKKRKSGSS